MDNRSSRILPPRRRPWQGGVTLVEVLISLALGLIVIAAAIGIFLSSREANRNIESLSRIQENARIVFDLMSRSMREVGGVPCGAKMPDPVKITSAYGWCPADEYEKQALEGKKNAGFAGVAVQIPKPGGGTHTVKYPDSSTGLDPGDSVRFITLASEAGSGGMSQIIGKSGNKLVLQSISGFDKNGLILACNPREGVIFTGGEFVGGPTASMPEKGEYAPPATIDLAGTYVPNTGTSTGTYYLAMLQPEVWFIGANDRGGTSLYRITGNNASADEVAPNATKMTLAYLVPGKSGYLDASEVDAGDWPRVLAVRVFLTLSDNSARPTFERTLMHTVSLRNRR